MFKELHWRLLLLGAVICTVSAAATPYVTLKLGMSVDLSFGGMFVAAALLARHAKDNKQLAAELNIIQAMIGMVSGIGFMVVIMAAFYYIQNVFGRDVGFHPETWQIFLFLVVSANLGIFMGVLPRSAILKDKGLPWPTAKATLSVAQTLTDPETGETNKTRRGVLVASTAVAGFLTFLKDGLGVITPMVGNGALKMAFGLEFIATGFGMLVPLSVGLSGLLGVWVISAFGETVAKLTSLGETAKLAGTSGQNWGKCSELLNNLPNLEGGVKSSATEFLTNNCGHAMEYVSSPSHFKLLVQWMMWPATAMMIAAALTSIIVPMVRAKREDNHSTQADATDNDQQADEHIPMGWVVTGIIVCVALTVWMTSAWFQMSWMQALLAVAIQPILIISGLRVLGVTGQGPVSLMANATQFLFGLIWPAHISANLSAAYVSANPQASSENVIPSFWVAQRLGGRFKTLIVAQLIMVPIGALLTPLMFNLLEKTYGIGLADGQLSAPTGLKIASLALVMEKGLSALPHGALTASIVAAIVGVLFELLLSVNKTDVDGKTVQRFSWVPIPAAFGFALILPPSLTLGTAFGAVIAAVWRKFAPKNLDLFGAPLASGLIAGEAIVGSIALPLIAVLMEVLKPYL